jgi:hypothetical protein
MDSTQFSINSTAWWSALDVSPRNWQCSYCGNQVASNRGYKNTTHPNNPSFAEILICGYCGAPSFFLSDGRYSPLAAPGEEVPHVPGDLAKLFREARDSAGQGAHTAAVMVCRKILMHVAVGAGADKNQQFVKYVQFLAAEGYLPPKGEEWIDYVRTRSNEANHEITLMDQHDSGALVGLVEMLLRFIYELPSLVPEQPESRVVDDAASVLPSPTEP